MHRRRGEDAVSPVVGSILILLIMVMAIGGIIAFGVPAIQGLQDHAEFQNVITQFQELDGDIRNLRDPQNVRISAISINKGQISLSNGDRWAITVSRDAAYNDVELDGWEQEDAEGSNENDIRVLGAASGDTISAWKVTGSTFLPLGSCTADATGACSPSLLTANPDEDVLRFQVKLGATTTVKAETWMVEPGRVTFRQTPESQLNQVHYEMGAVLTQQDRAVFLQQTPTVKDPDSAISDNTLFLRLLRLDVVDTTVSGQGRHSIVTNLVDNYGEARGRPSWADALQVRVQVDGDLESAFCNHLLSRTGWATDDADRCTTSGDDDSVNVYYRQASVMRFDLIHSEVDATARSI